MGPAAGDVSLASCFRCREESLARTVVPHKTLLGPCRQTEQRGGGKKDMTVKKK